MTCHYPDLDRASWKICFNPSEALSRSGQWHVISMEFLRSFHRRLLVRKPVVAGVSKMSPVLDWKLLQWMLLSSHLSRHNFSICSCDFDTCIQASTIVSFNHVTTKHISSTNSTVVGSLWPREPTLWPAKRMTIFVKQSVFLFNTKPRMGVLRQQMEKFKTVIKTLTHWTQKIGKTQLLNANYWKFTNLQVFFTPLTFYDNRLTILCLRWLDCERSLIFRCEVTAPPSRASWDKNKTDFKRKGGKAINLFVVMKVRARVSFFLHSLF